MGLQRLHRPDVLLGRGHPEHGPVHIEPGGLAALHRGCVGGRGSLCWGEPPAAILHIGVAGGLIHQRLAALLEQHLSGPVTHPGGVATRVDPVGLEPLHVGEGIVHTLALGALVLQLRLLVVELRGFPSTFLVLVVPLPFVVLAVEVRAAEPHAHLVVISCHRGSLFKESASGPTDPRRSQSRHEVKPGVLSRLNRIGTQVA